ncbi:MAG: hypothetical protein ABSC51_09390 [Gaiellaceae bacterium]|jgi:hypothetical protein
MKKHLSKRRVVFAAIVVVALAIASGVAFAYFSSSGSNTGTAGVGTSQSLAVAQSGTVPSGLVPGGPAQDVQVTVTNNASFKQSLSALTISLDNTQLPAGCDASWFTVTSPTVASPIVLAAHASTNLTGSIQMTESNSLQDNCKNATLHLNFVAS